MFFLLLGRDDITYSRPNFFHVFRVSLKVLCVIIGFASFTEIYNLVSVGPVKVVK